MLISSLCLWPQLIKSVSKISSVNTCCPPVSLSVQNCWLLTRVEKQQLLISVHQEGRSHEKHSTDDERGERRLKLVPANLRKAQTGAQCAAFINQQAGTRTQCRCTYLYTNTYCTHSMCRLIQTYTVFILFILAVVF